MQYRKRPDVLIEATQWFKNGDHPLDYAKERVGYEQGMPRTWTGEEARALGWEGGVVRYFRRPDVCGTGVCKLCGHTMHEHGWIETLRDSDRVCPGDWVITGTDGKYYAWKPEIFNAIYEPVIYEPVPASKDPEVIRAKIRAMLRENGPTSGEALAMACGVSSLDAKDAWWPLLDTGEVEITRDFKLRLVVPKE